MSAARRMRRNKHRAKRKDPQAAAAGRILEAIAPGVAKHGLLVALTEAHESDSGQAEIRSVDETTKGPRCVECGDAMESVTALSGHGILALVICDSCAATGKVEWLRGLSEDKGE